MKIKVSDKLVINVNQFLNNDVIDLNKGSVLGGVTGALLGIYCVPVLFPLVVTLVPGIGGVCCALLTALYTFEISGSYGMYLGNLLHNLYSAQFSYVYASTQNTLTLPICNAIDDFKEDCEPDIHPKSKARNLLEKTAAIANKIGVATAGFMSALALYSVIASGIGNPVGVIVGTLAAMSVFGLWLMKREYGELLLDGLGHYFTNKKNEQPGCIFQPAYSKPADAVLDVKLQSEERAFKRTT